MPTLIYGTRRSLLKTACLKQAVDLTAHDLNKRALLIVPEQTKMAMEQAWLELSAAPGLMLAEVLSFRRLAWRLLGEVGRQPLNPIDQVGRAMLIHRVLHKEQSRLHAFASLAGKPGFVNQIAAVLGDLKRYRISEAQLLLAADQVGDKALRTKSQDLARVLAGYDEALGETGLTDAEDDLNRLADVLQQLAGMPEQDWPWPLSRLRWLCRTQVWITGFGELRDFTPQEDAVIAGLSAIVEHLTLTVAADAVPADKAALDHGADAYVAGRKTAWRLQGLLPGLKLIALDRPVTGLPAQIISLLRTGHLPEQQTAAEQQDGPACRLHLVQAGSTDDELTWVAGEIRRLVQLEEYRYRDVTIAVSDLPGMTPRLRAVFREYGIPLFMDMERPLSGTPFMRYVLGLLDTGLSDWTRQPLMSCLRSGICALSADEVDRLENAWLARGLFRKDRLFADRFYREYDLPTEDPAVADDPVDQESDARQPEPSAETAITDELLALRDRALAPLRQVLDALEDAPDVKTKVAVLRRFLVNEGIPDRIDRRVGLLLAADEMDVAVVLAQSWNALGRVLDQLLQLSPDLPASLQQFRDLLAAGMDAAASGVIPSAIDQVSVGDLNRSMLRQSRILFLVGASAANIPPPLPPEGLLKDPDRQMLSRLMGLQLPSNARDKAFADAFVLETLLTRPSDLLYLTAPDAAVSHLFGMLADQYPDCFSCLPAYPDRTDARINAPGPAFRWLLAAGKSPDGDESAWPDLVRLLAAAGFLQPDRLDLAEQISEGTLLTFYQEPVILSVSQLEKYAGCPFSHLAERLLALRRRPEWKPELTETGTLLHGILELALQAVSRELLQIPEADRQALLSDFWQGWLQRDHAALVDNWLRMTAKDNQLTRLFDAGLNASIGRRVRQTAQSSLSVIFSNFCDEPYVPVDFEWTFGPETENPLCLMSDGPRTIWLRGKIDRVDRRLDPDCGSFRIIDYKSGSRTVDYDALYHGLALQLPVYLAAYARAHPGTEPEDAAWFTVNRPILTIKDNRTLQQDRLHNELLKAQKPVSLQLDPPVLEQLCHHSLQRAAAIARELLSGRFPVRPARIAGRRPPCDFCDYMAFCHFDPRKGHWHRLEKMAAENPPGSRLSGRQIFLKLMQEEAEKGVRS
jgi:ATP-dependent helicase/nuclease subunit B